MKRMQTQLQKFVTEWNLENDHMPTIFIKNSSPYVVLGLIYEPFSDDENTFFELTLTIWPSRMKNILEYAIAIEFPSLEMVEFEWLEVFHNLSEYVKHLKATYHKLVPEQFKPAWTRS